MKANRRFSLRESIRYALSELMHSWQRVTLTTASLAVSAAIMLVLVLNGYRFYEYQRELLSATVPTLVTATAADRGDLARRFTEERLRQLNVRSDVRLAYPKIELGVNLASQPSGQKLVVAEGVLPGDPRLAADRFAWRADIPGGAVLSRRTFQSLGGTMTNGRPTPEFIILSAGRTTDGQEEERRIKMKIAGVVHRQEIERLWIPLETAMRLEAYCSHQIDSVVPERDDSPKMRHASVIGYVQAPLDEERLRRFEEAGFTVEPLAVIRVASAPLATAAADMSLPANAEWFRCRLTPTDGRGMDEAALARLRDEASQVFGAVPELAVSARIGNQNMILHAAAALDSLRPGSVLQDGRWISETGEDDVVLPARLLEEAAGGSERDMIPGQRMILAFTRTNHVTKTVEEAALGVRLAGFAGTDEGYGHETLARKAALWAARKSHYNGQEQRFESLLERARRQGHVRCTIIAADTESLQPLVQDLEARGYQTESSIALMEGLRRLGRALITLIVFFSIGACLNAVFTVFVTSAMNVRAKSWEIGLLRALAVSTSDILRIFLVQGLFLGVAGLVSGIVVAAIAGPLLIEPGMRVLFGAAVDQVLSRPLLTAQSVPLLGCAAGIAILCSLAGIAVPTVQACRMSPTDALRRRE